MSSSGGALDEEFAAAEEELEPANEAAEKVLEEDDAKRSEDRAREREEESETDAVEEESEADAVEESEADAVEEPEATEESEAAPFSTERWRPPGARSRICAPSKTQCAYSEAMGAPEPEMHVPAAWLAMALELSAELQRRTSSMSPRNACTAS